MRKTLNFPQIRDIGIKHKYTKLHGFKGETDLDKAVTYTFEPGKPFSHEEGDPGCGGQARSVCHNNPVAPNIILCHTEVIKKTFFFKLNSSTKVGEEGICAGKINQWVSKCSNFGFMFYNLLTCAACLKVSLENP